MLHKLELPLDDQVAEGDPTFIEINLLSLKTLRSVSVIHL